MASSKISRSQRRYIVGSALIAVVVGVVLAVWFWVWWIALIGVGVGVVGAVRDMQRVRRG